jgi:DNA-binding CsgD family transcriptional regulator
MREADVNVTDAEFDEMGIGELVELGREAALHDLEELSCHGDGAIVRAETERRFDETRLDELDCVDRWEHVSEARDIHLYVIEFTAPALPESLAEKAQDLVGTCDPDLDHRGASISLTGSQDAIAGMIEEYEGVDVSPNLQRLGDYEGDRRPLDELTDRQREVIRTAYNLGYFEVPREASTEEVATELCLDPSTVTEHLQRAERNLIGHHL